MARRLRFFTGLVHMMWANGKNTSLASLLDEEDRTLEEERRRLEEAAGKTTVAIVAEEVT